MAVNKVDLNGETLIDLTADTATAEDVAAGKTFHLASGEQALGTAETGGGGDLSINGNLIPCRVAEGANVAAGDFVELLQQWGENEVLDFNATNGIVRRVDDTRLIIGYSFDSKARARILKLENGVVTVGDEFTFTDTSTATIRALEVMGNNRVVFQLNAQYLRLLQISDMQLTQVGSANYPSYNATIICKHSDSMIIGSSLTNPRDYISLISIENDTFTVTSKVYLSYVTNNGLSTNGTSCKITENIYAFPFSCQSGSSSYDLLIIIMVSGTILTQVYSISGNNFSPNTPLKYPWSAGDGYLWCIPKTLTSESASNIAILFHWNGSTLQQISFWTPSSGSLSGVSVLGFSGSRVVLSSSTTVEWFCLEYDESSQHYVYTEGASYSGYLSTGRSYASEGTSQLLALLNQATGTSLVQLSVSDSNVISISDTQPSSGYDYIVQTTSSRIVPVGIAATAGASGQNINVYVPQESTTT